MIDKPIVMRSDCGEIITESPLKKRQALSAMIPAIF